VDANFRNGTLLQRSDVPQPLLDEVPPSTPIPGQVKRASTGVEDHSNRAPAHPHRPGLSRAPETDVETPFGAQGQLAELALPEIVAEKPDIILMDVKLPGMSGIECAWGFWVTRRP